MKLKPIVMKWNEMKEQRRAVNSGFEVLETTEVGEGLQQTISCLKSHRLFDFSKDKITSASSISMSASLFAYLLL
jgi:hypothetical protein